MRYKDLLLFVICLTFSLYFTPINSQIVDARKITEVLCSDSLSGRGYVNNGVNRAGNFLENEFKNIGLTPFFGDSSYVQHFSFDVNTFPDTVELLIDGERLRPGIDYLVHHSSGSFNGVSKIAFLDTSWISRQEPLVPIVFSIDRGELNTVVLDISEMTSKRAAEVQRNVNNMAIICNVIYLTNEKFTWSVASEQFKHPIIYLKKRALTPENTVKIHINSLLITDFPNKNLLGYIPAKKKHPEKAKTIVFSAHYDHLGIMGTYPNKTIFPGGNDNASGTTMLLTMADYFKKNPSKYNFVFMAFAGEEAGLLGSKYFVKNKTMDLSSIKFLINLDIMGSGEDGITAVNGKIFKKQFKKLVKVNKKKNYVSQVKSRGETANSDHYFFYKEGVPSFFIYTMGTNQNYHDVYDTYGNLTFVAYDNIVKLLIDFVNKL